jgi:D-sedoheptulose 7-phosphate isomerase
MGPDAFYAAYFAELSARLHDAPIGQLVSLCDILGQVRGPGRKVMLAGNGASAAIASHVAVDLTKTAGVRAVSFNESDLITCFSNDYGYDQWIARAIEFYADGDDVVILISSSGRSPNVVNAARRARELGLTLVTMSGFDAANPLRAVGNLNFWVASTQYNIVETTHQSWLLAAIDHLAAARTLR